MTHKTILVAFGGVVAVSMVSFAVFGAGADTEKTEGKAAVQAKTAKGDETPAADTDDAARRALPVALIDKDAISLGFLEKAIELQQVGMMHREPMTQEQARHFLDRMVDSMLMANEAKRRGYGENPEVVAITKNKLASLMHRKITEDVGEPEPSDADLKKYYDDNYDTYHKPEKVRVRHILIKDKARAAELLKQILDKKVKQQEFRQMAKDNTEDEETKQHGGDLGFFTWAEDRQENDPVVPKALVEAAFKLEKNGEVYPKLIETEKGFHILMRTGHRKKMDFSFEDSKERIKLLVSRDIRKAQVLERINQLKEKYPVEIFEENLKHVVIDLSQTSGPE